MLEGKTKAPGGNAAIARTRHHPENKPARSLHVCRGSSRARIPNSRIESRVCRENGINCLGTKKKKKNRRHMRNERVEESSAVRRRTERMEICLGRRNDAEPIHHFFNVFVLEMIDGGWSRRSRGIEEKSAERKRKKKEVNDHGEK